MEPTPDEPKDVIVLGAIKKGAKKFDKIQKMAQIDPEELNSILEKLEERKLIEVEEKRVGWVKKSRLRLLKKVQKK